MTSSMVQTLPYGLTAGYTATAIADSFKLQYLYMQTSPYRIMYLLGLAICASLLLVILSSPSPNYIAGTILSLAGAGCIFGLLRKDGPRPVMPGRGPIHQLANPPLPFIGRKTELHQAAAALKQGRLVAIFGEDGAGKTALALKLASTLLPRYPDAQFHLDLGGGRPEPLSAQEAQASVLHSLDPLAQLPDDSPQVAALYHSALQGKHALLLLDNAASAEQVQALLPPSGNLALLTARTPPKNGDNPPKSGDTSFDLPKLAAVRLARLSDWDSGRLITSHLRRRGVLNFSWLNHPATLLLQTCGGLPGALRLVAGQFNRRPAPNAGALLQRFNELRREFGQRDAALRLCYENLTGELQKRWRTLAVFSGSFDLDAAAAVWEIPSDKALQQINALEDLGLLDDGPASQRYIMMPTTGRAFASSLLTEQENREVHMRHAGYYRALLDRIDSVFAQNEKRRVNPLPWLDLEWANIRSAQQWISTNRQSSQAAAHLCSLFPNAGVNILSQRLSLRQLIAWLEPGLQAAADLGYRQLESQYLGGLGNLCFNLGEMRKAVEYYDRRLLIDRAVGDRRSEATTLSHLGIALTSLGDLSRAVEYFQLAAPLFHEFADRYREGLTFAYLGDALRLSRQPPEAIRYYQQALEIFREFKDRRNEAVYTGSLGLAYANQGELPLAFQHYQEALQVFRAIDDQHGAGVTLKYLADTCSSQGQAQQAVDFYQQALSVFRQTSDQPSEAEVLSALGVAHLNQETPAAAALCFEQALVLDRQFGNRRNEVKNLTNLGLVYQRLGDLARSAELYQQALLYHQEINDQQGEVNLYWNLGLVYAGQGDLPRAIASMQMLVDYENATGQTNAAQHATQVEELRKKADK